MATGGCNATVSIASNAQELVESTPFTTEDDTKAIIEAMYSMNAVVIKRLNSYIDFNFYIQTDCGNEFVLKVFNKQLSMDEGLFEAQTQLMMLAQDAGITVPVPIQDNNGKLYSFENLTKNTDDGIVMEGNYMIRLLKYIPGEMVVKVKRIPLDFFYDVGNTLARMHNAWKDYKHPSLNRENFGWHMRLAPNTRAFTYLPKEQWQRDIVTHVLDRFEVEIIPVYHELSRGVIHADMSEQNLLVQQGDGTEINDNKPRWTLSGVLDFGHVMYCPYIFDIGISLAYMMLTDIAEEASTADVCKWYLAGYEKVSKLPDKDVNMIVTIICARLVQSLLFGLYYYSIDPSRPYVLSTQEKGWQALENVWKISIEDIQNAKCPKE